MKLPESHIMGQLKKGGLIGSCIRPQGTIWDMVWQDQETIGESLDGSEKSPKQIEKFLKIRRCLMGSICGLYAPQWI